MMKRTVTWTVLLIVCFLGAVVKGGPYREKGICSYIGPNHKATTPWDPNGWINPIFRGWADNVVSYDPTPQYMQLWWRDPTKALGQSMSDTDEVYTVSLGDLSQDDINAGVPPGQITLSFTETIRDQNGYDFVVFENGFYVEENQYFCDLGYVEVSSDGTHFARFPSVSLTASRVGAYGMVDITNVYNLGGKHPNSGDEFTGTPFDLSEITNEPNVVAGLVDLNNISYVRIVDIPGSGNFYDNARKLIDPCTWPNWGYYDANHPIYDPWPTYGSGGFDLEAIGVLQPQQYGGDINLDGVVDYEDLEIFAQCWLSHFGQDNYLSRCDLAKPKDLIVNFKDFAEFAKSWRKIEQWRSN
ncbi:MAG: hypothetical protein ABSG97_06890 [Sedimentisphaerales bacterium]|jgi:hypothetical protein